ERLLAQTVPNADRFLGKPVALDLVDSYLAVHADGTVTLFTGKVDIGTGGRIALRQMAGEELDIPLDRIAMIEGDTALTPNQGATAGSYTIARGGPQRPGRGRAGAGRRAPWRGRRAWGAPGRAAPPSATAISSVIRPSA